MHFRGEQHQRQRSDQEGDRYRGREARGLPESHGQDPEEGFTLGGYGRRWEGGEEEQEQEGWKQSPELSHVLSNSDNSVPLSCVYTWTSIDCGVV